MSALPSGTVTFLFTDIEGSTSRWEHQPEAMSIALARHDAILRSAIQRHDGHVVKTMGDAFHAAFARALDALAAALDAQRRLGVESWGETGPLRVRMAIHTGAGEERDGDYYGPPLNRAARLMSAGHGGQILLSQSTHELIRDALPESTSVVDLGERRLKDLIRPEHVFQLVAAGLPTDFPPLRTLDARPNNLPLQPTPLLGRDREVTAARERLLRDGVPLLTLTGPGGTGKTRLSLQVAAELIDQFADGVYFVALAPISDPDLVPATIAQTLEIRDVGGRSALDGLKEYLRDCQMLLVLDNFEQILTAAPVVGELLGTSRRLKVLVTSRAPLELRGEHELPVPPLALPDPQRLPKLDILSQYASVALFIERASAISPDFSITNENAPAVAEICVRLDGLPLAIELAAARIRLLSPRAMLTRLERRLPMLTGGARNLPARQQTLRGAIAWSYDMLDDEERALFRRLATFVGGCTLEAAEAVCKGAGDLAIDMLDGVASLLAKSLLQQREGQGDEPRFGMLETIREYGLERLEESGELAEARRRHACHFLAMATEAGSKLKGPEQAYWLARLEAERDNLRAVLSWCQAGEGDEEVGLGLAGALLWFWNMRGSLDEARRWQDAVLARPAAAPSPVRARVLFSSGMVALSQSDFDRADALLQESLDLARTLGDREGVPIALGGLSQLALARGDLARASAYGEEALALVRVTGDHTLMALGLGGIGLIALSQGDVAHAEAAFQESLALSRKLGDTHGIAWSLNYLGLLAVDEADHDRGTSLIVESLGLRRQLDDDRGIAGCFEGLAHIAGGTGDPERAGRLLAAASTLRDSLHAPLSGVELRRKDQTLSAVRRMLDVDAFERIWASGAALSLQNAVAYALEEPASTTPPAC